MKRTLILTAVIMTASCSQGVETSPNTAPAEVSPPQMSDTIANNSPDMAKKQVDDAYATEIRSAESHTHGDAELAVVLENGVVTIELDSPLYNLLGFEHAPESQSQKDAVTRAEAQLGKGAELFTLNAEADCQFQSNTQSATLFKMDGDHEDHTDNHDDEDHSHDEDDAHEDEHHEDTHKDVILQYEFQCETPAALTNVSVNLFEFFDELSEIDATYLGPSTQKQVELTRSRPTMDLQP